MDKKWKWKVRLWFVINRPNKVKLHNKEDSISHKKSYIKEQCKTCIKNK